MKENPVLNFLSTLSNYLTSLVRVHQLSQLPGLPHLGHLHSDLPLPFRRQSRVGSLRLHESLLLDLDFSESDEFTIA